jgi:uncharacterized protein YkwD
VRGAVRPRRLAALRRREALARHRAELTRRHVDLGRLADSTCPDTGLMPSSEDTARIRAAVICLIDRERARHGEDPLRLNHRMQAAAQHHSNDMLARGYFEHEGPGGESVADRLRASGYLYSSNIGYVIGENIAWGTLEDATPAAIVAAWMGSPEHRANILDPRFRNTGIGVAPGVPASMGSGQPGGMYTQDFGRIITG